ncbi:ABC transporter ATP-binding protein [Salininema proteolyticum]|uniref:ABC transporter ATP-binding protein n=1 Tax=Salininema proteolyticum TaxID=1607685 RepID=A0ABV8TUU7_9ACTN
MSDSIVVDRLTVRRGHRPVLHGINARMPKGSITGLLGPSGAGKTTLMRAIVGTQKVRSGGVTVEGHPAGSAALRYRIGYVTQDNAIYGDLTVERNIAYYAALYRAPKGAVKSVLAQVGLTDHAGQRADRLSGGQRTRVSLACALVGDPDILVLDEPTVGLDPVLREQLWDDFRDLADDGRTLVVSSHVMDEADRCDRVVLIREGRVVADETPAALKRATGTDDLDEAFLTVIRSREED